MEHFLSILGPTSVVAFGGLVCLASEAFIVNERKHAILPWIGTVFLIIAALLGVACMPEQVVAIGDLYAADTARAWLHFAIIGSALAAMAGLQHSLQRDEYAGGEPYALTLLSAAGVMLMVSANHYIGLFVGLELASIAIYATVGARRHRMESGEGLLKYLVMGAVFSAIFMYGVALTYGATGGLAYGLDVLQGREELLFLGQVLIMIGLLFKVGAVPFHFWSPDAYAGAPIATTGYMASVMKIGGFAALGAIWLHLIAEPVDGVLALGSSVILDTEKATGVATLLKIFAGVAILSLLVGNFTALTQNKLRRLMAFSSVSHAGYMLLAFALPTVIAPGESFSLASLWYYLIGYGLASAALLALLAGIAGHDDADELIDLSGAGRRHPAAGFLATLLVASLAGLPPTAGFLGKYLIFSDLVAKGQVGMALLAMLIAVVGAVYYIRFIIGLWSGGETTRHEERVGGLAYGVASLVGFIVLALLTAPDVTVEPGTAAPSEPVASHTGP